MNDTGRKDRIEDEVIVDCYDEYEMAMGLKIGVIGVRSFNR